MMNKVHKPTGNGTTHKIREQLNFKDNKKWKQFSSRRLELIDKFGLSERKASEQDDNIRQIATILRTEFGYPVSSSGEFEKLVTAAVQSVRRNRKRCTKTRNANTMRKGGATSSGSATSTSDAEEGISKVSSPVMHGSTASLSSSAGCIPPIQSAPSLPVLQPRPVRVVATRSLKLDHYGNGNPIYGSNVSAASAINCNEILRSVIMDLVYNHIPLAEQCRHDTSPSLTDLAIFSQHRNLLSLALASSKHESKEAEDREQSDQHNRAASNENIPFFLREKILLHIQRSKTCMEIATEELRLENCVNLCMLGDTCIKAAVSFVMERFFSSLPVTSTEYITQKVTSLEQSALICMKFFAPGTKSNMQILSVENKVTLFQLIIGAIVKDFGFDPCLYPLGEVFHDLILRQYPLVCSSSPSQKTAVLTTLSMKPQLANRDVNRKVLLKFQDKEQRFTFPLLSNGPPTMNDVLENLRQLFQIPNTYSNLALFHNNTIIKDDMELASILNQFSAGETIIEIKEPSSASGQSVSAVESSFNGLTILSNVSTTAAPSISMPSSKPSSVIGRSSSPLISNYTHSNTASVAALDSIISRISSPVAVKAQSANGEVIAPPTIRAKSPQPSGAQTKGSFEKGLPQPVFQPLL
ncbi:FADL067Cp [Eremothecium gossypii FDAG1]|nr:FADL067Cp [Eremothecium gossypii FDAG1]